MKKETDQITYHKRKVIFIKSVDDYEVNQFNKEDMVIIEFPLTVYLNGEELVTLLCTPEKIDFLALGFLRSEGFIKTRNDVRELVVDYKKGLVKVETKEGMSSLAGKLFGRRTLTTGCGRGTTFYSAWDSLKSTPVINEYTIKSGVLMSLMRSLQERSGLFKDTGGVHSAALCHEEKIIYFYEDVGRHNAIDKIVGQCLWENIPVEDKILISSGRLSSEMLLKAAKLGISILASRSAPTSLCLDMAEEVNITVIGFVRGKRMNIYTCPERVIV